MKLRSLLGVFVAASLAVPLHAQSQTPSTDAPTGLMARVFEHLEELREKVEPQSLISQAFQALEDARTQAMNRAGQDARPAGGDRG